MYTVENPGVDQICVKIRGGRGGGGGRGDLVFQNKISRGSSILGLIILLHF